MNYMSRKTQEAKIKFELFENGTLRVKLTDKIMFGKQTYNVDICKEETEGLLKLLSTVN